MHSPDELEKKRFYFLKKLYELSDGTETKFVNMYEIGSQLGFDRELTISIVQYLKGEGLIQSITIGSGISITHYGIKEVEKSLLSVQQRHESEKRISKLNQGTQIFISYANEDYDKALKLYNQLKNERNLNPWIDKKSILPGQKWKPTISEAIRKSRFFIALLYFNSVDKIGYVQRELKEALDILQEYPEQGVYIIPARLDDCNVSDRRLQEIQYVDLFLNWDEGFRSILDTIEHHNK